MRVFRYMCTFRFILLAIQTIHIRTRNTIRVSNSLDRDQARRIVGPDLGPNCLQKMSADESTRFPYLFLLSILHINLQDHGIYALVEPLKSLPPDLEDLFQRSKSTGDLTQQPGETIFWTCMQQYVSKFADQYSKTVASMTPSQKQFLMQAVADIKAKFQSSGRTKRQTHLIVRREIRMLSPEERADYFWAVNALKMDASLPPNVYGFLANFHSAENVIRAHFGPGFPGWHRVYIFIYEYFLRQHVPTVTLPYWASVLDNGMTDSTQSVIWSPAFMGNGIGRPGPGSGPFANWTMINETTVFERNIGFGPLYTWENLEELLNRNRTRNEQILIPTAETGASFEGIHGGPHNYVGGSMSRLNTAARDPIFFMHHCFVDMIWQEFRNNQVNNGINPETDYPYNASSDQFRQEHSPFAWMGFFHEDFRVDFQQWFGYSQVFDNLIRYDPIPSCTFDRPDCGSPYLFCNILAATPRCVGRTVADVPQVNYVNETKPKDDNVTLVQNTTETCFPPQLLNDFMLRENSNGIKTTKGDWVKVAVKVIVKRPPQFLKFSDYSLYGFSAEGAQSFDENRELVIPGHQRSYSECENRLQTVGKIKLVSYGLNYDGSAEEYALSDNRLGISETTGFIPVKRPSTGAPSYAIISAFDTCGRVCKPFCFRGNADGESSKDLMNGGIRITTDAPLQYGDTFADATLSSWQQTGSGSCPRFDQHNAPLTFYCDYAEDWYWADNKGQTTEPPERHIPYVPPPSHISDKLHLGPKNPVILYADFVVIPDRQWLKVWNISKYVSSRKRNEV